MSDYFGVMRCLLDDKVPGSLERSADSPTPVAASIYELIMAPIRFTNTCKDTAFRYNVFAFTVDVWIAFCGHQ